MTSHLKAALLAMTMVGTATAAHAGAAKVAYTSFTTGHGFNQNEGPETVGTAGDHLGYLPAGYIALAASFVPTISGTLDYLDIALVQVNGLPAVTVTLVPDNGSGAPLLTNPVLETIIAPKLQAYNGSNTSTKIVSAAKPTLTAGQTYWIIVTAAAYDDNIIWLQSNNVMQRVIYTNDGGQTYKGYTGNQAAFDVVVKP